MLLLSGPVVTIEPDVLPRQKHQLSALLNQDLLRPRHLNLSYEANLQLIQPQQKCRIWLLLLQTLPGFLILLLLQYLLVSVRHHFSLLHLTPDEVVIYEFKVLVVIWCHPDSVRLPIVIDRYTYLMRHPRHILILNLLESIDIAHIKDH